MNWILVSLKIEVVVMSCCLCALLTTVAVFKNRKKCLRLKPYTLYSSNLGKRSATSKIEAVFWFTMRTNCSSKSSKTSAHLRQKIIRVFETL